MEIDNLKFPRLSLAFDIANAIYLSFIINPNLLEQFCHERQ